MEEKKRLKRASKHRTAAVLRCRRCCFVALKHNVIDKTTLVNRWQASVLASRVLEKHKASVAVVRAFTTEQAKHSGYFCYELIVSAIKKEGYGGKGNRHGSPFAFNKQAVSKGTKNSQSTKLKSTQKGAF